MIAAVDLLVNEVKEVLQWKAYGPDPGQAAHLNKEQDITKSTSGT